MSDKIITHIEGLEKAKSFCAYQERCHKEIEEKLRSWKLTSDEIDYIISHLLEDDYLNEERFAKVYAGSKFRQKKWGKVKIELALKKRNLSPYCIARGLEEIPDEDYLQTLSYLIDKKSKEVKSKNELTKKSKVSQYCIQKGYEPELVWKTLASLKAKK